MFSDVSVAFAAHGFMTYNVKSQSIIALCARHGPECRRTRTVREPVKVFAHNTGQGRPIGLLAAWLVEGEHHDTSEAHRDAVELLSLSDRRLARASFSAEPRAQEILKEEAGYSADGPPVVEPAHIR